MSIIAEWGTKLTDWLPFVDTIINVVGMILIPVVIIYITKRIQEKEQNHNDKMNLFKVLMTYRNLGWSVDMVHALNMIDIVFCDDKNVREAWKAYYETLCIQNPNANEQNNISKAQYNLLNEMATVLGYKKEILWDAVQKPYLPQGMLNAMSQQQQYQTDMNQLMSLALSHARTMEMKQPITSQTTYEVEKNNQATCN